MGPRRIVSLGTFLWFARLISVILPVSINKTLLADFCPQAHCQLPCTVDGVERLQTGTHSCL